MDKRKALIQEITIAERQKGTHDLLRTRVRELKSVLKLPYQEFTDDIFRSLIEKVIVKDKKTLRFVFKCGMEQDFQAA